MAFYTAADFILNVDLKKAFDVGMDVEKIRNIINDIRKWYITVESLELEYKVQHKAGEIMGRFKSNLSDLSLLVEVQGIIELLQSLPIEINFWHMQNIYYRIAKSHYKEFLSKSKIGDKDAVKWVEIFKQLGQMLRFNIQAVLPEI